VPGVLEDSSIPLATYPLQNDGLTLKQITEKLLKPFQIKLEVDPAVENLVNQAYPKTEASETQTVADYICELAKQKDIVVTHTNTGRLYFTKPNLDKPVITKFGQDLIGTDYLLTYNGQALSTPITVLKQADKDGGNAAQYTIDNPYVPKDTNHFRPKTLTQSSGDDNNTKEVAVNELKSQIKQAIKLEIQTDRWEVNGKVIMPGDLIEIENKDLYLFKKSKWFVEQVDLTGDNTKTTAKLTCVLPDVYSDQVPTKNIFYD
jgi:prophage tail gpP-like protein